MDGPAPKQVDSQTAMVFGVEKGREVGRRGQRGQGRKTKQKSEAEREREREKDKVWQRAVFPLESIKRTYIDILT